MFGMPAAESCETWSFHKQIQHVDNENSREYLYRANINF